MSDRFLSPFVLSGLLLFGSAYPNAAVAEDAVTENTGTDNTGTAPKPTFSDVRYGRYARNVLDVYLPSEREPAGPGEAKTLPVLVFFHGGGWMAGDKQGIDASGLLNQGIAVVSANYRFTIGSPNAAAYPAPMLDAARVVQYVRHRASDWNLDPSRVALAGRSAGAVMAMWIGYQDDLCKPESDDPVARESTRVACVLPSDTPTTFDRDWILKNVGGPKQIHLATYPLFRIQHLDELDREPKLSQVIEASPVTHVTADDPPTFLSYRLPMTETPLPESVDSNLSIHHPRFGTYLHQELEKRGIPCFLTYKGRQARISLSTFLKRYLIANES